MEKIFLILITDKNKIKIIDKKVPKQNKNFAIWLFLVVFITWGYSLDETSIAVKNGSFISLKNTGT